MAVDSDTVPVSGTTALLDTVLVQQEDGVQAHREGVFVGDPEYAARRQKVSEDGLAYASLSGVASSGNTTTTPLSSGATFTGTGEQNDYPGVMVSCITDNGGTLYFDFSVDGTNWGAFPTNGFELTSGIHEFHTAVKGPRYFRVRLVNDTGAQSYLRLYTYYGVFQQPNSPLNQSISLDGDSLSVRPSNFDDEVRIGRRTGIDGWTKFGYRESLTASAGEETIWATSGNFTPLTSAETFTIAYTQASDGSSANGAKTLIFYYIDSSGLPATAVHTLGSDGSDVTSFSGLGINRVAVASSGSTGKNAATITITATTAGTTQAVIPANGSVTQQAIYFVGSNHDAVAKFLWWNIAKPGGGDTKVTLKAYAYNRAVATTYEVFRVLVDTSTELTGYISEPVGFNLSPTDVLYFTADTANDGANISLRFSLREYQRT